MSEKIEEKKKHILAEKREPEPEPIPEYELQQKFR